MPIVERVFNNALDVFNLKDNLEHIRVDALFELNDKINQEPVELEQHKILFQYLDDEKENSIKFVLLMLYCFGKAIENYEVIAQYFDNNKSKLGWIGTFIFKIKNDQITKDKFIKECGYILNQHPDLLQVIQDNLINHFYLLKHNSYTFNFKNNTIDRIFALSKKTLNVKVTIGS